LEVGNILQVKPDESTNRMDGDLSTLHLRAGFGSAGLRKQKTLKSMRLTLSTVQACRPVHTHPDPACKVQRYPPHSEVTRQSQDLLQTIRALKLAWEGDYISLA
jgi:hypothetical protein